jgi:nitrogenase-stabilizing/protective protein
MNSLTQRLKALSSAEDFLQFFGVAYDEQVVRVNRLHILKRFFQYLQKEDGLAALDEVQQFRRYRELLARAHGDFVHSNAATERVFKVFQQADGRQVVSVSGLKQSLADRRAAA